VIDFIEEAAPLIKTREGRHISAFQMLEWFLFPRPQQHAYISSLSGGERRRLYLLYTLIHQPNVLFLDEPTNDLDIKTLTVLEEYLDHFQGSLVVVSHDRYFLDRTVDYLVSFDAGQISQRYPAPFATYQQLRAEESQPVAAEPPPSPKRTRSSPSETRHQARPRKLTFNEQRELEQLEVEIEALETEKAQLQTEINASGADYRKLQSLADQLQDVEAALETKMVRWLELSEIGEQTAA
jgi:ATP-binding cassette subfamily F protein uup